LPLAGRGGIAGELPEQAEKLAEGSSNTVLCDGSVPPIENCGH